LKKANSLNLPEVTNAPKQNELCIKRENYLTKIDRELKGKEGSKVLAIIGMGGFGKTQLAKDYAQTYGKHYDVVWWMDGNQDLLPQLRELGSTLNAKKSCPMPDLNEISILKWIPIINDCTEKHFPSILFIIDDVKFRETITPIMQGFKNARILITSRNKTVGDNIMHLKCFTREESIRYLEKTLPGSDTGILSRLAETVFDYPLALAQASSYIRLFPSVTLEEYIKLYQEKRKELWKEEEKLTVDKNDALLRDYKQTVSSTFTLLLDQIKKSSPHAFELLKFTSFLGNQDIPKRFLKTWSVNHKKIDELVFHEALSSLIKYSIFEKAENDGDDKPKEEKYSIHASLHKFIRESLTQEERAEYISEAAILFLSYLPVSTHLSWKTLFDDRYLEFHLDSLI
jgi:hypothetical protein